MSAGPRSRLDETSKGLCHHLVAKAKGQYGSGPEGGGGGRDSGVMVKDSRALPLNC